MTPTHTDSPLRRSEIGVFRTPAQVPVVNDDEEERRARRRTVIDEANVSVASTTIEDNQVLKDCLKIYSENKLSKDNAWSVSLIDTLSNLLDKHHKALNNFKVAGSSLEASSKVYGLRVDSIHTDVVRMSAGLNKRKVVETNDEDDREEPSTHANENGEVNDNNENGNENAPRPKRKKKRRQVSTVTRNIETINGRLDTNPFTDPIFAKLNSIVGSINSSNRLLQNILPSADSELKIRTDYIFWNSAEAQDLTFSDQYDLADSITVESKTLANTKFSNCVLRPNQTGYLITDTPADPDDDEVNERFNISDSDKDKSNGNSQMEMAFDMHAEVEQTPLDTHTFVDVDMDFEELSQAEQLAINNCKGLRRAPVIIEDMRPVDSTSSNLEYSYRALDKISQFWAGPSHWKFKKSRKTSLTNAQRFLQSNSHLLSNPSSRVQNEKTRRRPMKRMTQQVNFGETHDDKFQKLDENKYKIKKANIHKKWDAKKLKLPTDLLIDHDCFDVFTFAPGIRVVEEIENPTSPDIPIESGYDYDNPVDQEYCSNIQHDDDYVDGDDAAAAPNTENNEDLANISNQTVMEIATDFEGAPDKVMKIVVPFAKRAKVIDMKQLKNACLSIIQKQMTETEKENIPNPPNYPNEKYNPGVSSFKSIYKILPKKLTTSMVEALSPSVALYSILHLANDQNFRLVQQDDLTDIQILQLNI